MGAGSKISIRDRDNFGEEARVVNGRLLVDAIIDGDGGLGFVTEDQVESKGLVIKSPQAGDELTIWIAGRTTTLTKLSSVLVGSASPQVNWTLRTDSSRAAAGTEIITGGSSTTSTTTPNVVTSFDFPFLLNGRLLWIEIASVSGSVEEFHLSAQFDASL